MSDGTPAAASDVTEVALRIAAPPEAVWDLVADVPRRAPGPRWKRDVDHSVRAIDDRFAHLRALGIRRHEIADVLGGEVRIEARD